MFYLESIKYYLGFILSIVFFVVTLVMYYRAKKQNKKNPGTYTEMQIQSRKALLIASSVIFGLIAVVVIGYIALLMMVVAFM